MYWGHFHQVPDASSGPSKKQHTGPFYWQAPETSLSSPQAHESFCFGENTFLVLFPPETHSLTSSPIQLNRLRTWETQTRKGSVFKSALLSTCPTSPKTTDGHILVVMVQYEDLGTQQIHLNRCEDRVRKGPYMF